MEDTNRRSLDRRKAWSIRPSLWFLLSLPTLPWCHRICFQQPMMWCDGFRPGACPCSSPLSLCTGTSLCPTESEPELPCSPSLAPPEEVSPVWAFYMSLAGSGHIWPGCKPLVSAIDECRLYTGRTWRPVRLWTRWPPPPAWSRKATPGFLRRENETKKSTQVKKSKKSLALIYFHKYCCFLFNYLFKVMLTSTCLF